MKKIVIDKDIPFIKGVFEPYFNEVLYLKGVEFTQQIVLDADALVIRTRTKCNSKLLEGSAVKIIASATIGTDHIDLQYCQQKGIKVVNAAGCNAGGVMQYVFTALYSLAQKKGFTLPDGKSACQQETGCPVEPSSQKEKGCNGETCCQGSLGLSGENCCQGSLGLSGETCCQVETNSQKEKGCNEETCCQGSLGLSGETGCPEEFGCQEGDACKSGAGDNLSGRKNVLGVIGVGNVGSRIANFGEYLGFEVLRCDPRKEREQTLAFNNGYLPLKDFKDFYSLDYLLQNSDIISIHVNLEDSSRNMVNDSFLDKMKDDSILINSSRGEVHDDSAILNHLNKFRAVVLDVWNNEPNINVNLLNKVDIATPHIAGYSYEGKVNGTKMAVRQVADFFNINQLKEFAIVPQTKNTNFFSKTGLSQSEISEYFTKIFPIFEDDSQLRKNPESFENLRATYNYRREFYVH